MIELEKAKLLCPGDVILDAIYKNADGTPARWKVNGKVKEWKRDPSKISIPLKYGLWTYDYLTEHNLEGFNLPEELEKKLEDRMVNFVIDRIELVE